VSQNEAGLEATLCAAYRDQADLYAKALACCTHELSTVKPGQHAHDWLPQLVQILDRVAVIERQLATVKEEWQRQNRPAGPALRTCLARVADLLRPLAAVIDRTIESLEADRNKLIPQIEQVARLRRMQQAYDRTSRVAQR
jgi:hypothetical protein